MVPHLVLRRSHRRARLPKPGILKVCPWGKAVGGTRGRARAHVSRCGPRGAESIESGKPQRGASVSQAASEGDGRARRRKPGGVYRARIRTCNECGSADEVAPPAFLYK